MKRGLFFIGLVLLLAGMVLIFATGESCTDDSDCVSPEICVQGTCGLFALGSGPSVFDADIILRLSDTTNAHGEKEGIGNYNTEIRYSNIFGNTYAGVGAQSCKLGENIVLKLSAPTNAHAQGPAESGYIVDICYGDLDCSLVEGNCWGDIIDPLDPPTSRCVVKLSDTTNAHLETCDNDNYGYSICCEPGAVDCELLTTKTECWSSPECTWTPPFNYTTGLATTSNDDGGGCCGLDEGGDPMIWNENTGCIETFGDMCLTLWITNRDSGHQYIDGKHQYCAQITSGLSYGFWYDTEAY